MASYSPVFSSQFIVYGPETPNETFLVPAGFTAVIRQISIYQEIGAYDFALNIADSEAAPQTTVWTAHGVAALAWVGEELRVVVPENGWMQIYISEIGSSPGFYVGGYLLRNNLT